MFFLLKFYPFQSKLRFLIKEMYVLFIDNKVLLFNRINDQWHHLVLNLPDTGFLT